MLEAMGLIVAHLIYQVACRPADRTNACLTRTRAMHRAHDAAVAIVEARRRLSTMDRVIA